MLEGAEDGWLYYEFMNFLYGQGGAIYEKDTGWQKTGLSDIRITSEASINAIQFFVSLKPYTAGDFYSTSQFQKQIY